MYLNIPRTTLGKSEEDKVVDYYTYIQSNEWRRKANQAKQRAGYHCQICNRSSTEVQLDAHHRTYERLGSELPEDITVLCRNCHELYELNGRIPRRLTQTGSSVLEQTDAQSHDQDTGFLLNHDVDTTTSDGDSAEKYAKHFLPRLGTVTAITAVLASGIWVAIIEWQLLLRNWIQIINPFFQFRVFYAWIISPLSWQLITVTLFGYGLGFVGAWIVGKVQPAQGMFRWFWQWKATTLIKAPIFLLVVWQVLNIIVSPFSALLYVAEQQLGVPEFPIVLPVMWICALLLPLPLLHLTWDNRFGHQWVKLTFSIAGVLLLVALSTVIEVWWVGFLCSNFLLPSHTCANIGI